MSTLNVITIIALAVVLIAGIVTKLITKKKLNDLDGVDSMFIVKEEDGDIIAGKEGSNTHRK